MHNRGRERKAVSHPPIESNPTRTQGLYEHDSTSIRIPRTSTLKTTAVNDLRRCTTTASLRQRETTFWCQTPWFQRRWAAYPQPLPLLGSPSFQYKYTPRYARGGGLDITTQGILNWGGVGIQYVWLWIHYTAEVPLGGWNIIERVMVSFVWLSCCLQASSLYNSTIIEDPAWRLMAAKTVYDFKKKI